MKTKYLVFLLLLISFSVVWAQTPDEIVDDPKDNALSRYILPSQNVLELKAPAGIATKGTVTKTGWLRTADGTYVSDLNEAPLVGSIESKCLAKQNRELNKALNTQLALNVTQKFEFDEIVLRVVKNSKQADVWNLPLGYRFFIQIGLDKNSCKILSKKKLLALFKALKEKEYPSKKVFVLNRKIERRDLLAEDSRWVEINKADKAFAGLIKADNAWPDGAGGLRTVTISGRIIDKTLHGSIISQVNRNPRPGTDLNKWEDLAREIIKLKVGEPIVREIKMDQYLVRVTYSLERGQ